MKIDVSIVSHTHWDREWYLPFQEYRFRLVALVDRILEMLAAEPAFTSFTLDGQTVVIEDYLALRPQREAELKRLIESGRLLIGPWYVLPDEFLVSAESLVRNLLLGRRLCKILGTCMPVGYVPDTFGHIGQLPQILALCGIDSAVFRRGLSDEPTQLWWQSPDGTRLLTIHLRDGYDNAAWFPADEPGFISAVRHEVDRLRPHSPTPHILLMEGTDHIGLRLPGLPALIRAANEQLEDIRLRHGTLPEFISAVRSGVPSSTFQVQGSQPKLGTLPTVYGELRSPKRHHLLAGVLSTRMWIKQRNNEAETALSYYAEPLAAISALLGGRDLRQELWQSWRYLLQNHAHDSICGCGIDEIPEEMQTRSAASVQIAEMIIAEGLETLSRRVRPSRVSSTPQELHNPTGLVLTVFNPINGPRTDLVSFEAPKLLPGQTYRLVDSDDQSVPITFAALPMELIADCELDLAGQHALLGQIESGWLASRAVMDTHLQVKPESMELDLTTMELGRPDTTALFHFAVELRRRVTEGKMTRFHVRTWLAGKVSASFIARDVPGFGYQTYWLERVDSGRRSVISDHSTHHHPVSTVHSIENEFFQVEVDRCDGTLWLLDKRSGLRFQELNRLQDGGDSGDEYNYCPPTQDRVVDHPANPPRITIHDESPVGWWLEVAMRYRVPSRSTPDRTARSPRMVSVPIVTRVWLRPGVPRVDIETTVDNRAEDHRLRVLFPTPFHTSQSLAEGQFDLVARDLHSEQDTSGWAEQPVATAPHGGFVAVQEANHGLVLASRGLPEYELIPGERGATLALTLLRCVGWLSRDDLNCRQGAAGPSLPTPGAQCLDVHSFAYSLIPFSGSLAGPMQHAHAFRAPLRSVVASPGDGRLPSALSLFNLTPAGLVVSAIKPAEEGDGWIVRFWNSQAQPVTAQVRVGFDIRSAERVNLLEESQANLMVRNRRILEIPVGAKEIISVRLRPV